MASQGPWLVLGFGGNNPGGPRLPRQTRYLIRRMCRGFPAGGAPRIHGELLKLGFRHRRSSITIVSIDFRVEEVPAGCRLPLAVSTVSSFVAVGMPIARHHRVAGEVTLPRLPLIATCRFPALHSSEVDLQRNRSFAAICPRSVAMANGSSLCIEAASSLRMETMFPTNNSTSAGRFPM